MNKSAFFIVLLVLVAFSSTSKIASFDGVISKLVQLNQAAGKDSSDISILVSQVSSATKESNQKFDSFMESLVSRCDTGKKLQSTFAEKLNSDILSIKTRAAAAQKDNDKLEVENASNNNDLKTAQKALEDLKAQIAKAYEDYSKFGSESESKLVILKTLRDIITDELLVPNKGQSFVQLKTFNDKLHELKGLLEKSNDAQFTPLVSTLISLAQSKNFADQGILNQIIAVLTKLEGNLVDFRKKQESNDKKNIEDQKALAMQKVTQIKTLANMIATNESIIVDNNNVNASAQKDIDAIQKEIQRKATEVTYFAKICAFEDQLKTKEEAYRKSFAQKVKEIENKLIDLK